jgi:hypothetical protein
MDALNWPRIAIMVVVVFPVGLLVAFALWRKHQGLLGNLAGMGVIFGTAIIFILKESTELDALINSCIDSGATNCFPAGNSFTRYALYAFIALAEIIIMFLVGIRVEKRMRDRSFSPEWRSWGEGR